MHTERIPIKRYARALRANQTPAERKLWPLRFLLFRPQVPRAGRVPDWSSGIFKISVELNGSVHGLPWVKTRDKHKKRHLARHGFYQVTYANWYAESRGGVYLILLELLITIIIWQCWRLLKWFWRSYSL